MASPEDLFARFRRHADAPALAAVFDAVAPELLLVASHLASAPTGAEDLVQATFLDAIEKADRWDAARPLMPWLIGILVNHARLERRRQQRPLDAARLPQPAEPSPLDAVAASEVAEQVAAALRSLPRQFRQTLTLRLVHGLSPTEIAHALGCPVATVKTRLQRGLDWLRKLLPAGIAVGLAGMVSTGRGLAAVRGAVLARVEPLVPVAAAGVALGVIGGGVLMKKLVLAACVIVCVATLWFVVPRPDEPALAGGGTLPPASSPQTAMLVAAAKDSTARGAAPDERVAAPTGVAATSGSADLEFVWKELGTPAAGLSVSCDAVSDGGARSSLQADERGRLRLTDLRAGDYRLFGFFRRMHVITIRAGEETRARIEIEPGLRVDGTVVDGDGRGIAGAAVFVQYFADSSDREPRPVAVSRDDGTFVGATDRGGYFWAQKPAFVPSACRHELVEGKLQLRLVLAAGATELRGTVRTADRGLAADARVTIVRTTPRDQCSAPIVLRTDASGAFATSELGAGEHLLVAQAPGHAATPIEFTVTAGRAQSLEVQLVRGATVFGSVQGADGKPISANLAAWPAWIGTQGSWVEALRPLYQLCMARSRADAGGNYRIENVPGTAVTMEISAIDAVDQKRELQLQDGGSQRCDFALGGGGEIHGRVVDTDGRPQANWTVHVSPVRGGSGHVVSTDGQGAFSAGGLDGPEYRLMAAPMSVDTNLPWATATNVRPGADEVVLRVRHTADDAGWFTGTLLDARGAEPEGAVAAWITPVGEVQGGSQCPVRTIAGGRFELGPLPPGSYHVLVRIGDQGGVQLGTHDLPPRGRVDLGAARVPASGILELRFATADGRTVAPTELSAWDKAGNGGEVFERGADGIFRSRPVPAGIYRVFAWGEDFARLDQPAVVAAERTTLTELQVVAATPVRFAVAAAGWSQVQLQILDDSGKVLASPMLSVDTATGITWSRGLPRGTYSFEATAWPGGSPVRGTFVVRGESAAQSVDVQLVSPGR